jgi:conjugal transfer pilus assembly protein TraE
VKWGEFIKTWEGSLTENKWNRIINVGLAAAVLLLTYMVFTKDQIIVFQPETLGSEAWLTKSNSSESYKESWGLFLALLTGNITPANVDFLKDRLKPLLSPAIYSDVIDTMEMQAQDIKNDRISMRFEPRFVEYEKTTDKVFVYGYSFVKGATGNEARKERTYEYKINISNYAPMIIDLNTYEGKPRTERVIDEIQKKEEARRKRDE